MHLILLLSLGIWNGSIANALAPAGYNELCSVTGKVLELGTGEGSDMMMKRLKVNTIKLKIKTVKPSGIKRASFINCKKLKSGQIEIFRNCDNSKFKPNQKIRGLIGSSKGGGPHCIEKVEFIEAN